MSEASIAENVKGRIEWVGQALQFQQANGLVTKDEAMTIIGKIKEAVTKLGNDIPGADYDARTAQILLNEAINAKGFGRKFLLVYFFPVWLIVGGVAVLVIWLLIGGEFRFSLFVLDSGGTPVEISGEVILWGGLGGSASSIYYLRKLIYELQLTKYFAIYLAVYPLAGTIFGLAMVVIFVSGLLSVGGTPGYALLAAVAFLGGLLQQWAIETLKDIAEAIHKTARS